MFSIFFSPYFMFFLTFALSSNLKLINLKLNLFVTSSFCQFLKMQNIENLTLEGVTIFFFKDKPK